MPSHRQGPLRIAQVAPLYESVPPRLYGGTERVIASLTDQLVAAGHDITLFASGDSTTSARLVPACRAALRLSHCADPIAPHLAMVEQVARRAAEFDLVHFHIDYLHFPVTQREGYPNLTTVHGRLDMPDVLPMFMRFRELPMVSISEAQRAPLPELAWQATVPHGFPPELYRFEPHPGEYLAFVGRIAPEKRLDRAIEVGRRSGHRVRVAAKIDRVDRGYYTRQIAPLLGQPHVEFLGELAEHDKLALLAGALALVVTGDAPEPFGLGMVEALACGTPVIAFDAGAVREIIDDGVTGFICHDLDQAVAAVGRVRELSRASCRQAFEQRFTAERMARDYAALYRQLMRSVEYRGNGAVSRAG